MTTLLCTHPSCLEHDPGQYHPETPARLKAVLEGLSAPEFAALERREAPQAALDDLIRVHPRRFVERLLAAVPTAGHVGIDADTVMSPQSGEAALRAAGAVAAAVDAVIAGEVDNAFCAVRPPGHHAEPDRAMGFCLFNNVAVGALRARQVHGLARVAVVDFDVHHGNGTQAAAGNGVSFVSTHAFPAYPGTGGPGEQRFDPAGAIVNLPLPPHSYGTEAFIATWQRLLPAVAARVRPDLIVVSAGYDFAAGDPVGDLGVDGPVAARALASLIAEVAATYARGRVAYCLEGGYDLETLAAAVEATLRANDAAANAEPADFAAVPNAQRAVLDAIDAWRI